MQKMATRVFIFSSIAFGVIGIVMVLLSGPDGNESVMLVNRLRQLLFIDV